MKLKYHDGSYAIGKIHHGNKFIGIIRFYNSYSKLEAILTANNSYIGNNLDENEILWKRPNENIHQNFVFQSKDKSRVLIMTQNFKGPIYNCLRTSNSFFQSSHFEDCYIINREIFMKECDCHPMIDKEFFSTNLSNSGFSFKYNLIFNQIHNNSDPLYPSCRPSDSISHENIRSNLESWFKMMSVRNNDPFWFHQTNDQPFKDMQNPYLDINLGYFANRKMFNRNTINIFASGMLLHKGIMINGKISANITTGSISYWTNTLQIVVDIASDFQHGRERIDQLKIETSQRSIVIWAKIKESKLEGMVRILGTLPNDPQDDCEDNISKRLGFIGHFNNGIPTGYCWKGLLGGSFIHGKVNDQGEFSGDQISYINQDMKTGFKGIFENGIMINAKSVEVIGEKCNEEGIKILEFSSTSSSQSYHFKRPTIDSYGDQPFVLDPLDKKYINIASSTIDTKESSQENNENGAFANVDIPPRTVIAHNNGKISNPKETKALNSANRNFLNSIEMDLNERDKSKEDVSDIVRITKENLHKYRTHLDCSYSLDIQLEDGQSTSKYRSTRGHKLNHSFSRMNSRLTFYDSARFGIISAIETRQAVIPQGEEIFVHYGYSYANGPLWYKNLFNEFLQENDHIENRKDENSYDDVLNTSMSNFTQNTILTQHELLRKAMSSLELSTTKELDAFTLNNLMKKHMLYSIHH